MVATLKFFRIGAPWTSPRRQGLEDLGDISPSANGHSTPTFLETERHLQAC